MVTGRPVGRRACWDRIVRLRTPSSKHLMLERRLGQEGGQMRYGCMKLLV